MSKIEGEYFYELLPGFILSFIAILIVSFVTTSPNENIMLKFDQSQ